MSDLVDATKPVYRK